MAQGVSKSGARVAIEVGDEFVRAVEVESGGKLGRRGSSPLPAGYWDDPLANRQKLSLAIRSALSGAGLSAKHVVTALPRRLVTIKLARLPHADPEHIRGMVQFEAQQYVPFPLEDVVLDHQIISDETDEMTTVMIVAARRFVVEGFLGAFDDAGLEVTRVTVSSLGLAEHARGLTVPTALLSVEESTLDLAVVSDGKMLFSRAAATNDAGLAGEVSRSFAAYQNEHRGTPIGGLLVAGMPEFVDRAEQRLTGLFDVPVARMNGRIVTSADPGSIEYAGAAGIALGADGGGIGRINLVPQSRLERKAVARKRVQNLAALAAAALVVTLAAGYVSRTFAEGKKERAAAEKANHSMELAKKALQKVKSEHDRVVDAYRRVSFGLSRQLPVVDIVKSVSDAVPKNSGIYLTQFTVDRTGAVAIHGNSKTETAPSDLVIALMGAGPFSEVRLGYVGDAQTETTTRTNKPKKPANKPAGTLPAPGSTRTPAGPPSMGGGPLNMGGPGGAPTGPVTTAPSPASVLSGLGGDETDEEFEGPKAAGDKGKGALYSFIINCRVKTAEPPPDEKKTPAPKARSQKTEGDQP